MPLDIPKIRSQFPALSRTDVFLDNPGGTQVAQQVLDRMNQYLVTHNANRGGAFATARASDAVLNESRQATADFLNAARPEEIVFGPNMTTLTLSLARAFAARIQPGDTIVVTQLDHDANIAPWMQIAAERGATLEWVTFDVETGTLQMDSYEAALAKNPKLVALGYASNALGTINPVKQMTAMAKEAGALVFIDAVQYVPHFAPDVQEIGCDFLACSSYKFFGPHLGILYGKYDLLDDLRAYKVRPAPKLPPGKWETGTQNHEGIAGHLGALEYFEWIGTTMGGASPQSSRREKLVTAMNLIQQYEAELSVQLIETLQSVPGLRLYGIRDLAQIDARVATFSFTLAGWSPRALATHLGEKGIYVWSGNYYALAAVERLGLEDTGGMVRVGAMHYNTSAEIERLGRVLRAAKK